MGASYSEAGCFFLVWAPLADRVEVHIIQPRDEWISMERRANGYYFSTARLAPGARYKFRIDGAVEYPDPSSRFQPEGVHGPSEIVPDAFPWDDNKWFGLPLEQYVLYELNVGTYTPQGTFDAIIPYLDYLSGLGITALELMPVAQFPGTRNWGYDGVYPFAVQNSYGGPAGLKRLVNAAHGKGLAVVLDVVYNHLGPEGNYLGKFGPYFTEKYKTPWGSAVNFDGESSSEVRRFVIDNALYWVTEFHVDALRLDAVHAIFDESPSHILQDLSKAVHAAGEHRNRRTCLFAESDRNEARLVFPVEDGGMGIDAQWNDDFHHALHVLLTREHTGYYQDFDITSPGDLGKAFSEGYVYIGQYSRYRERPHGTPSRDIPATRLVVCSQNHDQVGNRMLGERLSQLVGFEALKLAAGTVLLSPFIPLLFAGEEYGELAPFQYFVHHSDPRLIEAVRLGRSQEFASFLWRGEVPDAQDEATFRRSCLDHSLRERDWHAVLLRFHKELLHLRSTLAPLSRLSKEALEASENADPPTLLLRRSNGAEEALAVFHFGERRAAAQYPATTGVWKRLLDSAAAQWLGPGGTVPEELRSDGRIRLEMEPASFCLLGHTEEN